MKSGRMYFWDKVSDMPENIRDKAHAVGMWDDDIDRIWFIKVGRNMPEEIVRNSHAIVEFQIDDGIIVVEYHS
jgi:3-oxoacyl-[acyl-carrier-protein] synthase III